VEREQCGTNCARAVQSCTESLSKNRVAGDGPNDWYLSPNQQEFVGLTANTYWIAIARSPEKAPRTPANPNH
jgi:hypothetical protein